MLPLVTLAAIALTAAPGPDPHSYANFDAVRVQHLHLDLDTDFKAKTLHGFVDLTLDYRSPQVQSIRLDTRDLTIESVYGIADGQYKTLRFALSKSDPIFGQALTVQLPGKPPKIRIQYRTAPGASGLQWLEPVQTLGKQSPFLFSQSQAIHARSWVPLQDSPSVRMSYSAHIRTPPDLLAVMSAANEPDAKRDGDYYFSMPQPIPSYLLAIAVGDLQFRSLGPRTGVYAEPGGLEAAARELEDTEKMVDIAEKLYGPYRWGRYDMLVLPPSFPFGGMENPRLTFLTPTFIAGDKSLVSLIAHELAHSWSGNLVTNATWDSFWLNEGFTSYVENRIVEVAYGAERATMEQALSVEGLAEELKELPAAEQKLRLNLRGRDPDDGLTAVAYDKGNWLLRFLESRYGRDVFDAFLRRWFDAHAFTSVSTDDFLAFYQSDLAATHPDKVSDAELRAFVDEPGIPDFAPVPASLRFKQVDLSVRAFNTGQADAAALPAKDWTTQEWLRFLNGLDQPTAVDRLTALDQAFKLTGTGNSEVAHAWYKLALASGYQPADAAIDAYLLGIGRRKLIVPLYEGLLTTAEGKARATRIYAQARPGYHPITQATLDALLVEGK